jgi:hypothetical protein
MKERLFLDGIHVRGDYAVIDQGREYAVTILSHTTNADPSGPDQTTVGAEVAYYRPFLGRFIEHGFCHCPTCMILSSSWKS